ncbi:MAG: hypothetical protein WEB00_05770 [Dehalococcoidia bacterium]
MASTGMRPDEAPASDFFPISVTVRRQGQLLPVQNFRYDGAVPLPDANEIFRVSTGPADLTGSYFRLIDRVITYTKLMDATVGLYRSFCHIDLTVEDAADPSEVSKIELGSLAIALGKDYQELMSETDELAKLALEAVMRGEESDWKAPA